MRRLNDKDWLKISAYIDDELPSDEKISFEERIQQDPELKEAVEKVQWTRTLLKNAPRRVVPHQFRLTRQMAESVQAKSRWNVWRYGIVSGIASVVFLVLAGIQFLPLIGFSGNMAAAPQEAMVEEMMMLEMDVIEEDSAVAEAPLMMDEAVMEDPEAEAMEMPAEIMAESAEEEIVEEIEEDVMLEMGTVEESEEVPTEETQAKEGEPSGGGGLPPTPTVEATAMANETLEQEKSSDLEEGEIEEVLPRAEETFAMTEDEEENGEVAGYTDEEVDLGPVEIIPEPSLFERVTFQNILLIGGMLLSAVIAVLSLFAAFRSRNRF